MSRRWLGNTALLLFSGLLALVLAELPLRYLLPPADRYYVWEPNLTVVFYPVPEIMPGITGPARFSVNSMGIRGDEVSESHRSLILAVGGSTTESLYLSQDEAWPMRLQRMLNRHDQRNHWVGNLGRSGMSTRDHILHFRHVLPLLDELDIILVMAGFNDLVLRLERDTLYDPAFMESPEGLSKMTQHAFSMHVVEEDGFYKRTGLWRLYRRFTAWKPDKAAARLVQSPGGESYEIWRSQRRQAATWRHQLPDLSSALDEYERNLRALLDLADGHAKRVIFITQPVAWREGLSPDEESLFWFGWVGDRFSRVPDTYYTSGALERGMHAYNSRLLEFCNRTGAECLDIAPRMPKGSDSYYDDVHFNEKGSRRFARELFDALRASSYPPSGPS